MIVVAGGGISGLAAAYYLSKAGLPVTLIEKEKKLGGVIRTEHAHGCTVELGPDSFLSAKPWAGELCRETGLGEELIGSNDHLRATWIWKGGRLERMPEGMTLMVPGKLGPVLRSPLLGVSAKIGAAIEVLRRPKRREEDISIADFVYEHFGLEVVDYIAEPLLAGVYGGDIKELSTASVLPRFVEWERKYGSLTRAIWKEVKKSEGPLFTTLKRGLYSMVEAIEARARFTRIHGVVDKVEKGWRVHVNGDWLEAEHLVVACRPSAVLPHLFPDIRYTSSYVVARIYNKADVPHPQNGFGFLVPRKERKSIAACTWVGTKFPYRVPDGKALFRCFVFGNPKDVSAELREKMGIKAEPVWERVVSWPESMPQYNVGHEQKVQISEEMLKDFPGLHLVGNAYRGVGIPDCVRMAKQVASGIIEKRPASLVQNVEEAR